MPTKQINGYRHSGQAVQTRGRGNSRAGSNGASTNRSVQNRSVQNRSTQNRSAQSAYEYNSYNNGYVNTRYYRTYGDTDGGLRSAADGSRNTYRNTYQNSYRNTQQSTYQNSYRNANQSAYQSSYESAYGTRSGIDQRRYDIPTQGYGGRTEYQGYGGRVGTLERGYASPGGISVPPITDRPITRRRVPTREERLAYKKKFRSRVMSIMGIAVIFLMCVLLLYRQTAIFGKNREIEALNSEYNKIIVTNEGIQASIDKSIELGNLESIAKNQLGMVSPDSSQIFYVDMGAKDEVIKSSSEK